MWCHIPVNASTQTTETGGLSDQTQSELQQDPEQEKETKEGRRERQNEGRKV